MSEGSLKFDFMCFNLAQKRKYEKMLFCRIKGDNGGGRWEMHNSAIVVIFHQNIILLNKYWCCNSEKEFEKNDFHRRIKTCFQGLIWKIWMIYKFFRLQVEVRMHAWIWSHATAMQLSTKCVENVWLSHSVPEILWLLLILRTSPRHFQDIPTK